MTCQQEVVRFIENFIIIWVDSKLHCENRSNNDIQNSITALHHIINSIKIFDTNEACIEFIDNQVKYEKIFLIISGSLGEHLIPQIEHNIKLDSIYIFCWKKFKHKKWTRQHHKIMGIFTDIQDICKQLKEDIKHCEHEMMDIQTLSSQTSKISNHLDASFMYSQLLKEILLSIEFDNTSLEQVKQDLVDFCRIHYAKNDVELCIIEEFKQNYSKPSPIWWYTRECFTYSMLNRALCTQDVEILMKMSFFICDLHRQLEQLHKTIDHQQILTVYRGQGMLHEAFNRMKQHQGDLISFNNFLSTSTSKNVALCFAKNALKKPGKIVVLFEMNIDPSISSIPFASLDKFSCFQEEEKEILFSMHTVFRINEIKPLDDDNDDNKSQLWHVRLTSTDADDEQLHQLREHLRIELSSSLSSELEVNTEPTWRLSKLLVYMGEYDKALVLYEMMIDKAVHDNNLKLLQAVHYQMAELFVLYKNDWNKAIEQLKEMFRVRTHDGNAVVDEAKNDILDVFSTIRNILLNEQTDEDEFHSTMSELLIRLISLYLNYSTKPLGPLDYLLVIDRYNYIGWVRKKQGNLSEAWTNHKTALEILHKHLPSTHPRLAITYNHIGSIHSTMNEHLNALDCFKKALDIQEKALQPYHSHLAETHFQMSLVFERLNKIDDAFHHAKKAIDIGCHAFMSSNDPNRKKYQENFDKILSLNQLCDELVL